MGLLLAMIWVGLAFFAPGWISHPPQPANHLVSPTLWHLDWYWLAPVQVFRILSGPWAAGALLMLALVWLGLPWWQPWVQARLWLGLTPGRLAVGALVLWLALTLAGAWS